MSLQLLPRTGRLSVALGPFSPAETRIIGRQQQGGEIFQAASVPNLTRTHNSDNSQSDGRTAGWREARWSKGGRLSDRKQAGWQCSNKWKNKTLDDLLLDTYIWKVHYRNVRWQNYSILVVSNLTGKFLINLIYNLQQFRSKYNQHNLIFSPSDGLNKHSLLHPVICSLPFFFIFILKNIYVLIDPQIVK